MLATETTQEKDRRRKKRQNATQLIKIDGQGGGEIQCNEIIVTQRERKTGQMYTLESLRTIEGKTEQQPPSSIRWKCEKEKNVNKWCWSTMECMKRIRG